MIWLIAAGLVLRLLFIGNDGFKTDISSFEAWTLTVIAHPLAQFYSTTQFADYPPGYLYVLWILGHAYAPFAAHDAGLGILKNVVKLPAIAMDLFAGFMVFTIARRFGTDRIALSAAALFLLNPATIFISAVWGQVDSVAGSLALLGLYGLMRSSDDAPRTVNWWIAGAWVALAASLSIKPQAAILIPLFAAFAFADSARRRERLISTAAGVFCGLALAVLAAVPFHPAADAPVWLYHRYSIGKDVYPYNSVNAFNLWTVRWPFWQPDSLPIFGLPQYLWGVVLVIVATILTVWRYVQVRTDAALLQSAVLLTLAFYMLSTRMHERYVFDGLTLAIAAIPLARRYVLAAWVLSITLLANLFYSLDYLHVVTARTPGINGADMAPLLTRPLSFAGVVVFFYLGYAFLGSGESLASAVPETSGDSPPDSRFAAREWFDPTQGLQRMRAPLDYLLAAAFGAFSFVLSFVNYWKPAGKIFDEVYFARAGEEYLRHQYIYESTHPPLTKLIITFSMMLFGGLHPGSLGDTAWGWRFMDVLFGALAVVLLYAFAKRLTGSTLFASVAAALFTFDGMHFVQSRIGTPEGIVVVFSLGTVYAFYRFWIASQSTVRTFAPAPLRNALRAAGLALAAGFALAAAIALPSGQSHAALVVLGCYFSAALYLLARLVAIPKWFARGSAVFATFGEGSFAVMPGANGTLTAPDGRVVDIPRGESHRINGEGFHALYTGEPSVTYTTPVGTAAYAPGTVACDRGAMESGGHATGWLVTFTVLLGMLVASKWYGVMAYGVSFLLIAGVWMQRFAKPGKPKVWGNPFGFRLDIALATIVVLSATVYFAVWIPEFFRQIEIKNLTDFVYRQYTMFQYHDTLVATHPYASTWWQWPLDWRPIAYYYKDTTGVPFGSNPAKCCLAEVLSLPNPLLLWFGLITVPVTGFLAWKERNKGYALLVIAYIFQWLPWMRSPRITFAYHFYVDIPLIVLCNAIVLQRLWDLGRTYGERAGFYARIGVCAYIAAVVAAFIWFYPILAGMPIPFHAWDARMWHGVVGNGWV
ncbi:MAG: phospholipid carrier-dependent glycosyltransferase [Candidatus Eremiobacteraeota bacterium]|nr:phospholipid carrier-dependent glycosyltransferase [Candidatus Eremiobacteraeota bacterium]